MRVCGSEFELAGSVLKKGDRQRLAWPIRAKANLRRSQSPFFNGLASGSDLARGLERRAWQAAPHSPQAEAVLPGCLDDSSPPFGWVKQALPLLEKALAP